MTETQTTKPISKSIDPSTANMLRESRKAGKTSIKVVDIDGTLVFTDDAQVRADIEVFGRPLSKSEFQRQSREIRGKSHDLVATKYRHLIRPNIDLVSKLNQNDEHSLVVVLTGRWKRVEEDTKRTLDEIGLRYDALLTNPNGEEVHDEIFKGAVLDELGELFDSIEVYEDKEDNIHYFKRRTDERFQFFIVRPEGMLRICAGYNEAKRVGQ
ncbi:MAG: hypothetical protein M1504_03210 [Candidatus Marsarchaeota archaeon]|nr:hypothetical protein [Candidatus Marsarchaeota archaeon]